MYLVVTKDGQVAMQGRNQAEAFSVADEMADAGEAAVVALIIHRSITSKGEPLVQGIGSWNAMADARMIADWAHEALASPEQNA